MNFADFIFFDLVLKMSTGIELFEGFVLGAMMICR